jgi:pimeloyl-ACP methyl ester carboxylesterase
MTTSFQADRAETRYVDGTSARFAYRRLGARGAVPLVMAHRFRGTMDHWDPAFLDVLSSERDVIVFDNCGVGQSSGRAPDTIDGVAGGLLEFVGALGLSQLDLLGWSMGGYVVQVATLLRPSLVRRLVVAGSGPGAVFAGSEVELRHRFRLLSGMPAAPAKVWQLASKPINDDEDFLYWLFPRAGRGREAGLASLRRLDARLTDSQAAVPLETIKAHEAAIRSFGTGVWDRLHELTLPVLIANGAQDVMIHAFASFAMAQRLPNAKAILYGDAGHAFLFQHADEFGHDVLSFLR